MRDKVFTEPDEVFGFRRRSSYRFREYLGKEALHQVVKRTTRKENLRLLGDLVVAKVERIPDH